MPVADHPVHERVRHDKPPSGCYNREYWSDGYYLLTRQYLYDGRYEFVDTWIPHNMSTKCRQINTLPECVDCQAEKDQDYIDRMKSL